MIIAEAGQWSEYLPAWETCMQGVYWFDEARFFDYTREEESRSLEEQFGEEDNIFLVALDPQPIGVLGIRVNGEQGTIRRYEPAVKEGHIDVGEALIAEGIWRAALRGRLGSLTMLLAHGRRRCSGITDSLTGANEGSS
jgi:hypothetical protein